MVDPEIAEQRPEVVGDKVTRIWQLLPASTLSPQLLVWVNSPTVTILEMASGMLPLLVSVTFCVAEVPKTTVVKFTEVGDNRTTVPVATRLTTWGLVESLSVMVSVPLLLPEKVGVKVTLMLHCAIAATDDPQALLAEKPALEATLEMVRVVPRLLKSTSVSALLLDPTTVGLNMLGPEIKGQVRCCRMRGGSGAWEKSKLSRVSLACASRSVSGGRPQRSSMNFSTEENSY